MCIRDRDDTEANNAIKQLNGAEYVGRSMVVKEALPKKDVYKRQP